MLFRWCHFVEFVDGIRSHLRPCCGLRCCSSTAAQPGPAHDVSVCRAQAQKQAVRAELDSASKAREALRTQVRGMKAEGYKPTATDQQEAARRTAAVVPVQAPPVQASPVKAAESTTPAGVAAPMNARRTCVANCAAGMRRCAPASAQ